MAAITRDNVYTELIDLLFYVDDTGAAAWRNGILTATGFAHLAHRLPLHSPAQSFCSSLVAELANEGKNSTVSFLLKLGSFAPLGLEDQSRLDDIKNTIDSMPDADWQKLFLGKIRRYQFMVEDLPPGFVQRPKALEDAKDLLLETYEEPDPDQPGKTRQLRRLRNGILGLHGFGGFGKTTLALAICYDEEVRQACFPDGILWATLGANAEDAKILELVNNWVAALDRDAPALTNLPAAQNRLKDLLADRQMLLVVDDVWNAADLKPFVQGGPRCARLATTRDTGVLPENADLLNVGGMEAQDAVKMLGDGLPVGYEAELENLAKRLGYWSILLRLARADLARRVKRESQPMGDAVADLLTQLDEKGLTTFDPSKVKERQQAVTATVDVSLAALDEVKRQRYTELGIFPGDTPIPLEVVASLWEQTGAMSAAETESLCSELFQLSLLLSFDRSAESIRLHDVLREYMHWKLPNRVQLHLAMVDLWGEIPDEDNEYAWRWVAYHLYKAALNSRQPETHNLADRLVKLVGRPDYQEKHKAVVKDLAVRQNALKWGLEAAAADDSPGGLALIATAARQVVRFRRKELRPEPLFELAADGKLVEAEIGSRLFDLDQNWREALLLALAWSCFSSNPKLNKGKALELRNRVAAEMQSEATLELLLRWVDVDLRHKKPPVFKHTLVTPDDDTIRNLLDRLGGQGDAEMRTYSAEGLKERGLGVGEGDEQTSVLAEVDGPVLAAYAAQDHFRGAAAFEEYIRILGNDNYPEYRLRSLWILLGFVLRHPVKSWVQDIVQKVFIAALGGGSVEFEGALPIAVLALQAQAQRAGGDAAAVESLEARSKQLCEDAAQVTYGRSGDSWAFLKRQMISFAQAFACLSIAEEEVDPLIEQTRAIRARGYAGYNTAAILALAETIRICHVSDEDMRANMALESAQEAAHNIQDPTFCARITARVNALRKYWWDGFSLVKTVHRLHETPQIPEFAATHYIDHKYFGRARGSLNLEALTDARRLSELAVLYNRPLEDFLGLNRELGPDPTRKLKPKTAVRVPDDGFAPILVARFAAEALANRKIKARERIDLIRALVTTALPNPTALDTVLARLLLAWGMDAQHAQQITPEILADLQAEAPPTFDIPASNFDHMIR